MKTVIYLDQQFDVPDDTKFVAADDDGSVYAYDKRPVNMLEYYARASDGRAEYFCGTIRRYPCVEVE